MVLRISWPFKLLRSDAVASQSPTPYPVEMQPKSRRHKRMLPTPRYRSIRSLSSTLSLRHRLRHAARAIIFSRVKTTYTERLREVSTTSRTVCFFCFFFSKRFTSDDPLGLPLVPRSRRIVASASPSGTPPPPPRATPSIEALAADRTPIAPGTVKFRGSGN